MNRQNMLFLTCLALLSAGHAVAATTQKAPQKTDSAAAVSTGSSPSSEATQSDVIGSKEAPGVFNIVPWKDKTSPTQKKEVGTSILRETLQPLDRDILLREIEFHRNTEQR
ncbi:MAG TPA: hypothetical protein DF427_06185 [Moraxellaceae bacterium]|nr:hypothetical protein [Moraxellaceae bacterium]